MNVFALIATAWKAWTDYRANAPRPATPTPSAAELADSGRQLLAELPALIAWLDAHPGAETAVDDVLDGLSADGVAWAAPAQDAVDKARAALGTLLAALSAFRSVPSWSPGPGSYRGR